MYHESKFFSLKDKENGLKKVHSSLNDIAKQWSKMSKLLADVKDPSLFQRAFSPGLQEYIEALALINVLESSQVPSTDDVRDFFPHSYTQGQGDKKYPEIIVKILKDYQSGKAKKNVLPPI